MKRSTSRLALLSLLALSASATTAPLANAATLRPDQATAVHNVWKALKAEPEPMIASGTAYDGARYAYKTTGVNTIFLGIPGITDHFNRYDTQTNTWKTLAHFPHYDNANQQGVTLNVLIYAKVAGKEKVYSTSGVSGLDIVNQLPTYNSSFYAYDVASNAWTAPNALKQPSPMVGSSGVWDGGDNLYITAGATGASSLTQITVTPTFYKYSISANTWTKLADAPQKMFANQMQYDGKDTIYVTGGGTSGSFTGGNLITTPTNAIYAYSISKNTWTALAPCPDNNSENLMVWGNTTHTTLYMTEGWGGKPGDARCKGGCFTTTFWKFTVPTTKAPKGVWSNKVKALPVIPGTTTDKGEDAQSGFFDGKGHIDLNLGYNTNVGVNNFFYQYTI